MNPVLGRYGVSYEHAVAARHLKRLNTLGNLPARLGKFLNLAPAAEFRVVQAPKALLAEEGTVCHIS